MLQHRLGVGWFVLLPLVAGFPLITKGRWFKPRPRFKPATDSRNGDLPRGLTGESLLRRSLVGPADLNSKGVHAPACVEHLEKTDGDRCSLRALRTCYYCVYISTMARRRAPRPGARQPRIRSTGKIPQVRGPGGRLNGSGRDVQRRRGPGRGPAEVLLRRVGIGQGLQPHGGAVGVGARRRRDGALLSDRLGDLAISLAEHAPVVLDTGQQ